MPDAGTFPFDVPYVIDKGRYFDRSFAEREAAALWPKVWLLAGSTVTLASPGDHEVFDLGRESVLLVRGEDGRIRAFHNVCLHRGTRLRECGGAAPEGFRCPYHGWRWGLDGRLAELPDAAGFPSPPGRDRTRLAEVACEVWAGFAWVSFAPEEPLRDFLGPVAAAVDAWRLDEFELTQHFTTSWACNWKTALDAFSETYHVPVTHPQLTVDVSLAQVDYLGLHARMTAPLGLVGPGASEAARRDDPVGRYLRKFGVDPAPYSDMPAAERRAVLHRVIRQRVTERGGDVSALRDDQLTDTNQYFAFPNVHLDFHGANNLTVFRYRPDGAESERSWFDGWELARRAVRGQSGDASPRRVEVGRAELPLTLQQDAAIVELLQRGMRSSGFASPVLSRSEGRIVAFHRNLDRLLGAAPGA